MIIGSTGSKFVFPAARISSKCAGSPVSPANTICEDAMCPNIAECWGKQRTATFMILGDICTRACAFCAVKSGRPTEYDLMEPARVAAAIADLKLKHAVITSVDRDDLADGGAMIFAETVREIRQLDSEVKIELLTPDFQGSLESVRTIIDARGYLRTISRRCAGNILYPIQVGLHDFV